MKQFFKKDRGFTLIEILVTIAIVAFLLVVSIPAFRNYRYVNDLSRSADLVQSAVYEAKNLSLAPQTDKDEATKYYVLLVKPETNEMLIYEADSENQIFSDGVLVKKFDLPSDVIFEDDITTEIFFSIEKQGQIVKPSEGDAVIKIRNEKIKDNNIRTITVNKVTGQVSTE